MAPVVKLIIAGPRVITDPCILSEAMFKSGLWEMHLRGEIVIEVVCGMAKGVDTLGYESAKEHGLTIHEFPADWDKHGRRAGPIRNAQMGDFADRLLAIWDGHSTGTKHMIDYAAKKGLPSYVHMVDYVPPDPEETSKPKPTKTGKSKKKGFF